MNRDQLSQFERRIAQLVEGSFARLFAGKLHPDELATRLVSALEDNARIMADGAILAPDQFTVMLNPADYATLMEAEPGLAADLAAHIVDEATQAGLRLRHTPSVRLQPDRAVARYAIEIEAIHTSGDSIKTTPMPPMLPGAEHGPRNPQLILQGSTPIPLQRHVLNIGRRKDNHISIDDARVSRTHAQLRLRFGHYTIFDVDSKGGTYVNGQRVSECLLKPGDVISLAGVMLIYVEDDAPRAPTDTPVDTGLHGY